MVDDEGTKAGLVAAAVTGDGDAFGRLVEPLRRELHLHCYRMLGSFHDAEDVLQDAELKAWRRLESFDRRASFRTWMYSVVTRTCLDALRTRRRRVLPQDVSEARDPRLGLGDPRHDLPWLEPYPGELSPSADPAAAVELRESVRLAFVRVLQLLPPRQRAVLILRDVLDWSASEVAVALGSSVASINSALQRARATMGQHPDDRATRAAWSDEQRAEIAARYVRSWEAGDLDGIVAMLTDDVTHAMPPWAAWFVGREALQTLYASYEVWGGQPGPGVFRILPTALYGELAFAEYCRERPGSGPYRALALTLATPDPTGRRIARKVSFVNPEWLVELGFPAVLE